MHESDPDELTTLHSSKAAFWNLLSNEHLQLKWALDVSFEIQLLRDVQMFNYTRR